WPTPPGRGAPTSTSPTAPAPPRSSPRRTSSGPPRPTTSKPWPDPCTSVAPPWSWTPRSATPTGSWCPGPARPRRSSHNDDDAVPKLSAGLLVHRIGPDGDRQVLLVHPGGPFWAKKDDGAWSIPKGEVEPAGRPGEDHPGPAGPVAEADLLGQAEREFAEELGRSAPAGERVHLGEVVQSGGKHVVAWAVEGDLDATEIASNRFELEWPPRS